MMERGSIDLVIALFRQKYRWYYWGTMKLIGYYWGVLAFTFDNRQSPFGPFPRLQLYLTYFFREIKLYKKRWTWRAKQGKISSYMSLGNVNSIQTIVENVDSWGHEMTRKNVVKKVHYLISSQLWEVLATWEAVNSIQTVVETGDRGRGGEVAI